MYIIAYSNYYMFLLFFLVRGVLFIFINRKPYLYSILMYGKKLRE